MLTSTVSVERKVAVPAEGMRGLDIPPGDVPSQLYSFGLATWDGSAENKDTKQVKR